jgi:hypothetical protein
LPVIDLSEGRLIEWSYVGAIPQSAHFRRSPDQLDPSAAALPIES